MKQIFIILSLFFIQITADAQFFHNTIIKTNPYQDIVAFNPTLGFEKPVHNRFSVEAGFMFRNRNWNSSGGEGNFGHFYKGEGYRIMLGSKVYFGKSKKILVNENQKAPFGWFANIQVAYSYAKTFHIEKVAAVSGSYQNTVDVEKQWPEINLGIGRQFLLFKMISLEFFVGPSIYLAHKEKSTIVDSENPAEIGNSETENYPSGQIIKPNVVVTIGYYIK